MHSGSKIVAAVYRMIGDSSHRYWQQLGPVVVSQILAVARSFVGDRSRDVGLKRLMTYTSLVDQAGEIMGVEAGVVRKWARQGVLKPVSGPKVDLYHRNLFQRNDVGRLRPENRPDWTINS